MMVARRLLAGTAATVMAALGGISGGTAIDRSTAPATPTGDGEALFVGRSGPHLTLGSVPYRFVGINAYQLASDYSVNYGCGAANSEADIDRLFAALRPGSLVRTWAFQHLAFNRRTGALDFTTIDRVVRAAERHGQKVILVLGNQVGNCDTPDYKTEHWYATGYRTVHNSGTPNGGNSGRSTPLSYWDYLHVVVPRYAGSPAVAIWQPINEPRPALAPGTAPEARCPSTAASTLRKFFDDVGGEIKRLAPRQLVGSGVIGDQNCGTRGSDYESVHRSPGIDVGSFHDYGNPTVPVPGNKRGGLALRIEQMARVGKPLIVDEVGITASDRQKGCYSTTRRRDLLRKKMRAQFARGVDAFLPWVFDHVPRRDCGFDIGREDPTFRLLQSYVATPVAPNDAGGGR